MAVDHPLKSVRCQDDIEKANTKVQTPKINDESKGATWYLRKLGDDLNSFSSGEKEDSKVVSEEFDLMEKRLLDPRGPLADHWRKLFLGACLTSLFVDPLFFYAPYVSKGVCIEESASLKVFLTVMRSLIDAFFWVNIYLKFRTALIAPSSRIFGAGELVSDLEIIASEYLRTGFWFDFVAALPLPQAFAWIAFPNVGQPKFVKLTTLLIIIFQFLMRLHLSFKLSSKIIQATGMIMEKAWTGAAFNLMLYMLASHVLGSCWYILSIERQEDCLAEVWSRQSHNHHYGFLNCHLIDARGAALFKSSNLSTFCDPKSGLYQFGIYGEALTTGITTSELIVKFFYSFWWGMKQLSSLGQGLEVSAQVGEIIFAIVIGILGLVLFALLVGNMQTYLQSTTKRTEEWRIMRADAEVWMCHRYLPSELKQRVRRYHHYNWVTTGGFDEQQVLQGLPADLRGDIKRHLYCDLVRRVPLFDQMDDQMQDAICERLKNVLYIRDSYLLREGSPVNEMLFIIRGQLDSYTTNGGRSGFLNTCSIGPSDFCGEELLTWAMALHPNSVLPSSTRTVKCTTEVEALALSTDDLKFVGLQFRRLHWKQLKPTFRFSSHQWRTWAACFIQASWSSYKKRRSSSDGVDMAESTAEFVEITVSQKPLELEFWDQRND